MLTGKQKRYLRGLGHPLSPVVIIGKGEITQTLIDETSRALDDHELIKVKILESCTIGRHEAAQTLASACAAEVAQVLGRTILLYRPAAEPRIVLPRGGSPPPTSSSAPTS